MNKTLKNRVIKALIEFSKTHEVIAANQKKAGFIKESNVTGVKKVQLGSLIREIQATIKEAPPKPKKKTKKEV